jgi:filamentous hemagglutinin family protein
MTHLRHDRTNTARATRRAVLFGSAALSLLMPLAASAGSLSATALPTGGQVTSGNAAINQNGSNLTVTQTSDKTILNWQSFNIGSQASVTFVQPNASSVALNRVTSGISSQIFGHLTANGQIFLINSAGILFGAGSQVNVGGLIASTMDIRDDDFNAGIYKFHRNGSTASVVNQGSIAANDGGYIGLLATNLVNEGTITAKLGTVALAAGETVTLTLSGSNVSVQVDPATVATLIQNNAMIAAPDGRVILTAVAADTLLKGVINNAGTVEATSLTSNGGTVSLNASDAINMTGSIDVSGATAGGVGNGGTVSVVSEGSTTVTGTILARAGAAGGNGGNIETSGHTLSVGGATVNASARKGKGGHWLLDPTDLTVDSAAANTIDSTLNGGTDVTLTTTASGASGPGNSSTGNGDINVNAALNWTGSGNLTLNAYNNIDINAPISWSSGSAFTLNAGNNVNVNSAITPSGAGTVTYNATTSVVFGAGATAIDLEDINLNQTINLSQNYVLTTDIDASSIANFTPIGNGPVMAGNVVINPFMGTFEGNGHVIKNLTINLPNGSYVGLFAETAGGSISDLNLANVNITGQNYVGALAGATYGTTITNSSVSGTVTSTAPSASLTTSQPPTGANFLFPYSDVGGLVGYNSGTITGSNASGTVVGTSNSSGVGGLVGYNDGTISASYATNSVTGGTNSTMVGGLVGYNDSTVTTSMASGAVTGGAGGIGGLIGYNSQGSVTNSYATGSVTGGTTSIMVGGLVGNNDGGTIDSTYSTGKVTGGTAGTSVGGHTGANSGTITNSYWNTTTSKTNTGIGSGITTGVTGFTTAQAGQQSTYSGFDFANSWSISAGGTYPYLQAIAYPPSLITYLATPVTWSVANVTAQSGQTVTLGNASLSGIASADSGSVSAVIGLFNGTTQITDLTNLAPGTYTEKVIGLTGSAAGTYTLAVVGDLAGTLVVTAAPTTPISPAPPASPKITTVTPNPTSVPTSNRSSALVTDANLTFTHSNLPVVMTGTNTFTPTNEPDTRANPPATAGTQTTALVTLRPSTVTVGSNSLALPSDAVTTYAP